MFRKKLPENLDEEIMKLSPWEFDQSQNGWRRYSHDKTKEHVRAADLIKEYISRNEYRILNQEGEKKIGIEFMYCHIGQLLALEGGHEAESIDWFNKALNHGDAIWKAFITANIGFLEKNLDKMEQAIKEAELVDKKEIKINFIPFMKRMRDALKRGEIDYLTAAQWES